MATAPEPAAKAVQRATQLFSEVWEEIDPYLDPVELSLGADPHDTEVGDDSEEEAERQREAGTASDELKRREALERQLLDLRHRESGLQARLQETESELEAQRAEALRRSSQDAAQIAKLLHDHDLLNRETRAKRRKVQGDEAEVLQLRAKMGEASQRSAEFQDRLAMAQREAEASQRQLQAEVHQLREELATERKKKVQEMRGAGEGGPPDEAKLLRERITELEAEVASLQLLLAEAAPERELAAKLRQQHAEQQEDLRSVGKLQDELREARAAALRADQEKAALRAEVKVRDDALRAAEDAARTTDLARRDLAAFAAAAAAIVHGPPDEADPDAAGQKDGAATTPFDLTMAWTRFQQEMGAVRSRAAEMQQKTDQAMQQERQTQSEASRLRAGLAAAEARTEELQSELECAKDESASLTSRLAVLREAITKQGVLGKEAPTAATVATAAAEDAPLPPVAARRLEGLERTVQAKQTALDKALEEVEACRKENQKLAESQGRVVQLQRVNDELWESIHSLEKERASAKAATAASARQQLEAPQVAPATMEESRCLEQDEAALQLQRFKKASKKFAQDFREGVYGLLGWKVEMKSAGADGRSIQWILTSRYQDGRELAFRWRPPEAGVAPSFELLSTPWGEQLVADHQAMAYLELYDSVPGFLAHVTANLVARRAQVATSRAQS